MHERTGVVCYNKTSFTKTDGEGGFSGGHNSLPAFLHGHPGLLKTQKKTPVGLIRLGPCSETACLDVDVLQR